MRNDEVDVDWVHSKDAVIRRLLVRSITEPSLRFPAVRAAIWNGLNPLPLLPSKQVEVVKEFFANEDEGSQARTRLLKLMLGSPMLLKSSVLKMLFSEISKDERLFNTALGDPNFPTLPGASDVCLIRINKGNAPLSQRARIIETLTKHWPEVGLDFRKDLPDQVASRNRNIRAAAARTLSRLTRSEAEECVRRLLQDPERIVRHAALISLVKLIGKEAAPELLLMLKDSAPLVRVEACTQIGNLKEYSMVDAVLERAADVSFRVRLAAFDAVAGLDRGLALRNLSRFSKDRSSTIFLNQIKATDQERAQFDEHSRTDVVETVAHEPQTQAKTTRSTAIELVKAVIDYQDLCDFQTFLCLRHFMLGRLHVTASLKDAAKLLEVESNELTESGILKFPEFVTQGSLPEGELDRSRFHEHLFPFLQGTSSTSLAAQALLIGSLKGLDGVRHDLTLELGNFRGEHDIDGAFTMMACFFWRIIKSAELEQVKEDIAEEVFGDRGDFPTAELKKMLLKNLQQWSLLRATPRCLGFLLATGGFKSWEQIPERSGLAPPSLELIDLHRKSRSTKKLVQAVWRGQLIHASSKAELLAGMGNQHMERVCDYGQRELFG